MTDSAHVGPIVFADETARSQLLEHGEVVTFRASERTTGDTWWRESRTGPKEGYCRVEKIDAADPVTTTHSSPTVSYRASTALRTGRPRFAS